MANPPSALNPQFQALYDAQLPQVLLAAQQQMQSKGLFNSGNAADAATKAQADLMASLLAQQQAQVQQTAIQQAQINQAQSAQEASTKAATRSQNIGLIGSGVGAGAGLLGLLYGKGGALGKPLTGTMMVNGQPMTVNGDGTYTPMQPTGVGGSVVPNNGMGGSPVSANSFDAGAGVVGPPSSSAIPNLGNLPGTAATPPMTGLDGLSSSAGPAPLNLPGIGGDFAGIGGALPSALADGSSPAVASGLDSLSNFSGAGMGVAGDLASSGIDAAMNAGGGDAAGAGLGALASFAKGGIITRPTVAQIGDAGPGNPEEVIPLNKLQGAIGPQGAAKVMAAVPQPGAPGYGQPPAQPGMSPGVAAPPPPGMPPAPMPSMWSQPSVGGPVPPPAPMSPLAALQSGGLLGNLFNRPRPA